MTQRHRVSKCYWKNGANRLAQWRSTTIFQSVKIQHARSAIKWSTAKQAMPVPWGVAWHLLIYLWKLLWGNRIWDFRGKNMRYLAMNRHMAANALLVQAQWQLCTQETLIPDKLGQLVTHITLCSYKTIPVLNLSPLSFSTAFTLAGLQAGPSPNHRDDAVLQGKVNLAT